MIAKKGYSFLYGNSYTNGRSIGVFCDQLSNEYTTINTGRFGSVKFRINGTMVEWITTSSTLADSNAGDRNFTQLNESGVLYYYIAIG